MHPPPEGLLEEEPLQRRDRPFDEPLRLEPRALVLVVAQMPVRPVALLVHRAVRKRLLAQHQLRDTALVADRLDALRDLVGIAQSTLLHRIPARIGEARIGHETIDLIALGHQGCSVQRESTGAGGWLPMVLLLVGFGWLVRRRRK